MRQNSTKGIPSKSTNYGDKNRKILGNTSVVEFYSGKVVTKW